MQFITQKGPSTSSLPVPQFMHRSNSGIDQCESFSWFALLRFIPVNEIYFPQNIASRSLFNLDILKMHELVLLFIIIILATLM